MLTQLFLVKEQAAQADANRSEPIMVVKYRRKDAWMRLILDLPGPDWPFVSRKRGSL